MTHLIGKGKVFTLQRFQLEWITEAEFLRWKTCEFFKEMIKIIPPELEVLVEIYSIAKSLRRNEKPDYLKLMKKVICMMGGDSKLSKSSKSNPISKSNSIEEHVLERKNGRAKGVEAVDEEEIVIKIETMNGKDKRRDRVR
jgi:hypothetical protein